MKNKDNENILKITIKDNFYGLANINGQEVVECIYDKITPLKNTFFVVKDKMAGILDSKGKILLHLQPRRLHYAYIGDVDIFKYKKDDNFFYFTFIDNIKYEIDADRISYNKKVKIVCIFRNGTLNIYNELLVPIQTGFDNIIKTCITRGRSMFFVGLKNSMWGYFRIKYVPKLQHEVIVKITPQYQTSEEALEALKGSRRTYKGKRHKNRTSVMQQPK